MYVLGCSASYHCHSSKFEMAEKLLNESISTSMESSLRPLAAQVVPFLGNLNIDMWSIRTLVKSPWRKGCTKLQECPL